MAVDRPLLFDTSHSLVYCHQYAQQEIGMINSVTKKEDEQLLTNVCYVQKHAMTVSNVAIAQSLVTPNCKSQLKFTQD